jgi:hypothetical protein
MENGERMEDMRNTNILIGKPEWRDHLGDLGIEGRIIVKLILKKQDVRVWIGFRWLR